MKIDEYFGPAIVDVDEWRDNPVKHRFVHGSFDKTYTRFILCFPEEDNYDGRFIQHLEGGLAGSEYTGYDSGGLFLADHNNAYYVESNQGHLGDLRVLKGDLSILEWRASAATAKVGLEFAKEMYGEKSHHGYLYGSSGGGIRTIQCAEAPIDIWDGFLPIVMSYPSTYSLPDSIISLTVQILGDKIEDLIDATDPGSSVDPFAMLDNNLQKEILASLYRLGFPRGAEAQLHRNAFWVYSMGIVPDRNYWNDFWSEEGFEGRDHDPIVDLLLIQEDVIVEDIFTMSRIRTLLDKNPTDTSLFRDLKFLDDSKVAIKVKCKKPGRYVGCTMQLPNGRKLYCTHNIDNVLCALFERRTLKDVEIGDIVHLDNRNLVAYSFHHRHFVSTRYENMNHLFVDGKPIYKPASYSLDSVTMPSGNYHGKMIIIQNAQDCDAWPINAHIYAKSVRKILKNSLNDRFRIYWTENATHVPPMTKIEQARYLNFFPNINQALNDLVKWIEKDIPPPPSTQYKFTDDGALHLPPLASERRGIQPVVQAFANGSNRADIKKDQIVKLTGQAETPLNTGYFVRMDWDFEGDGTFPERKELEGTTTKITSSMEHRYKDIGTYFATFRAFLHRNGDKKDKMHQIVNQARVRVVVT
jgi:hypothetical protein